MKKRVQKTVADILLKKWGKKLDWNEKGMTIKIGNYPPKKVKFQIATQDKIKKLQPYIDKVLKALGHSEALVTDESMVIDFINVFYNKSQKLEEMKKLSKKLKIDVNASDYIWQVAEKVLLNKRSRNRK